MPDQITQTLTHLFDTHRIILWYDEKEEMREAFAAVNLPDVTKIEIRNNEFGVKYRILRQEPDRKFLLYRPGKRPVDSENWLLDVELAHRVFTADQTAIWLHELGLPLEFRPLVAEHPAFFRAASRRNDLKKRLGARDTRNQVLMHMLAVAAGAESSLDSVLQSLLDDLAAGRDPMATLALYGLDAYFWEQVAQIYGYQSQSPTLLDLTLALFQSAYDAGLGRKPALTRDARVLLNRWKDSKRHSESFRILSEQAADALDIREQLHKLDFRDLAELDCFEIIERKILADLMAGVVENTIPLEEVARIVRRRRLSHWYQPYHSAYQRIESAARFFDMLGKADLHIDSFQEGVHRYARTWHRLDQLYREFIYASRDVASDPLQERMDNFYINRFLHELNQAWQRVIDRLDRWIMAPLHGEYQKEFYETFVAGNKILSKSSKRVVIISDALRYEAGEALRRRIRQEDRFDADIMPLVTLLPSYTQLGMAALLPHQTLRIADDATVLADERPTTGLENRRKLLEAARPSEATALRADDLQAMSGQELRALVKDHRVIYIYHNRIDAVGDKRDSESHVFEAVENALAELLTLIKKLTSANASAILITADHGFIYQDKDLEMSDYTNDKPRGDIIKTDRRFILGRNLHVPHGFRHWTSEQMGLDGDMEMLIPKSIQRLRQSGSGSRYVHGGASLQEIVIPLIAVHKKRTSDVTLVDVEILQGGSQIITTGQLMAIFYQRDPISDKVQPRILRAGLYAPDGTLVSESHTLTFDSDASEPRDREFKVRFLLTRAADDYNGQDVLLKLEEPVPNTSRFKLYKSVSYRLRRSFTTDFDF